MRSLSYRYTFPVLKWLICLVVMHDWDVTSMGLIDAEKIYSGEKKPDYRIAVNISRFCCKRCGKRFDEVYFN